MKDINQTKVDPNQSAIQRPDVFEYLSYAEYLQAFYQFKKSNHSQFSYRVLSRKIGLGRSQIQRILSGQSPIAETSIDAIAQTCELNAWEKQYFSTLVHWNNAKDSEKKRMYWERLSRLVPKDGYTVISQTEERLLTKWYVITLMELLRTSPCKNDSAWIAARFRGSVTSNEIREALDLLKSLGFVEDVGLELRVTNKTVAVRPSSVSTQLIRAYHKEVIPMAITAIEEVDKELRDISSISIALDDDKISEIKDKIRQFKEEVLDLAESQTKTKHVYQLNVQLFPMTKVK